MGKDYLEKIVTRDKLLQVLSLVRKSGVKIVFTNGCFDIIHTGHVRYLNAARLQGDLLIVGLNSDRSVKSIKGEKRPIFGQGQRAEVLACLECVDFIVVFDEPDPVRLIESLNPDVLVKGADWAEEQVVGADIVKANQGRVMRIPVVPDISTTIIIDRIISRYEKPENS
jgi:D-glycero-beta-D-manno-heptose 1-phosphate adenylyltransferase